VSDRGDTVTPRFTDGRGSEPISEALQIERLRTRQSELAAQRAVERATTAMVCAIWLAAVGVVLGVIFGLGGAGLSLGIALSAFPVALCGTILIIRRRD
jgi:hypothetical protein